MTWFKVDDKLHGHRKTRRLRASHESKQRDVAPFGLWVLAGSWAGDNGTGGFVPAEVLAEWDDYAVSLARRLVDAGFWWETEQDDERGFGFHDWTDYAPGREGIEDASESGRRGNHIRWHEQRGQTDPACEFCPDHRGDIGGDDRGDADLLSPPNREPVPTRPDPTLAIPPAPDPAVEFATWYLAYPRKVGKGAAAKAYRTARKKVSASVLLAAVQRQTPALIAKGSEFCPHPSTWLNGERWADEAAPTPTDSFERRPRIEPPDGLSPEECNAWYESMRRGGTA